MTDPHRWQPAGVNEAGDPVTRRVPVVPEASDGEYADMTKEELQAVLESRGLPKSGTKEELIERLNG